MNENSPICERLAAMVMPTPIVWRNSSTMANAATDLPTSTMNSVASSASGSRSMMLGSNNMPTATKNSTAKASRSGTLSSAARCESSDSPSTMPAKKAPSANETPNSFAAPKATPSAMASTASRKSSRSSATACSTCGMTRRPTTYMTATNPATLAIVMPTAFAIPATSAGAACIAAGRGRERIAERRQEHQREHHRDVLDDQPADRDPATLGSDEAALLERAQQHDRARDREREAEEDSGLPGPAHPAAEQGAHQRGRADLHDRTRQRDRPHGQQVAEREVHADAEHEEDHADLGQLVGDRLVGDEARRERPDRNARDQVADDRGHPQSAGERSKQKSEPQAADDRRNERCAVIHQRVGPTSIAEMQCTTRGLKIRPAAGVVQW